MGNKCGTLAGYKAHKRAKQPACSACKKANAEYVAASRSRARAKQLEEQEAANRVIHIVPPQDDSLAALVGSEEQTLGSVIDRLEIDISKCSDPSWQLEQNALLLQIARAFLSQADPRCAAGLIKQASDLIEKMADIAKIADRSQRRGMLSELQARRTG